MASKSQNFPFADENRLIACLILADYPKYRRNSFLFEELKNMHPEKFRSIAVLRMLSDLRNKKVDFEMGGFVFDKFSLIPADNVRWRMEAVKRISKNKAIDEQEVLHKILSSRFDFSDLEFALEKYESTFWEIAEYVDFKIIFPLDSQEKLIRIINQYIEKFRKGKLNAEEANFLKFEKQKEEALKKIRENTDSFSENLAFKKDEFLEIKGFRICECFLAMEQEKYLKINSTGMIGELGTFFQPVISFSLTKKFEKRTSKAIKKELPVYKEKGRIGYIYWPKTAKMKKIGDVNSRYFMLIKFLLDAGRKNPRPINEAFEYIKDGRHHSKIRAYREPAFAAVKDAVEKLRKINIDPLVIHFDEKDVFLV